MTVYSITPQYPVFTDLNGLPLESGYIRIGAVNDNPAENPVTVYWDEDLTIPIEQPIRTLAGAPNRNGSPGNIYYDGGFSILISDKNNEQVFYSPNGLKFYLGEQYFSNRNALINGDFTAGVLRWINVGNLSIAYSFDALGTEDSALAQNASQFMFTYPTIGVPPALAASDYQRVSQEIEDVVRYQGSTVTVSFDAKTSDTDNYSHIATSFTQDFAGDDTDVTGIGAKVHTLTESYAHYSYQVDIPSVVGKNIPQPVVPPLPVSMSKYGLIFNLWLAAGSDYDDQTAALSQYSLSSVNLRITNIQVIPGNNDLAYERLNIDQTNRLTERYYESSFPIGQAATQNGHVVYIAPGVSTTIPGFRFRTEKRLASPTAQVYSYSGYAAGKVYLDGTGNIDVASINDVGSNGAGSITLAVPTVAGGVYRYHWSCDAEYTTV
jgi:hypothetical protein